MSPFGEAQNFLVPFADISAVLLQTALGKNVELVDYCLDPTGGGFFSGFVLFKIKGRHFHRKAAKAQTNDERAKTASLRFERFERTVALRFSAHTSAKIGQQCPAAVCSSD